MSDIGVQIPFVEEVEEPAILSTNTYFWNPGCAASNRRANERKQHRIVKDYFEKIGMDVTVLNDYIIGNDPDYGITVEFYYAESCSNVYKHLKTTVNGKKSNILALRKYARRLR